MSGGSKFSSQVPKGDGWGVERAVAKAVRKIQAGERSPLIPIIGVMDIKKLDIDTETGNVVAHVRLRRVESLDTLEAIRDGQRLLLKEWANKRGEGAMLPFEEKEFIDSAFTAVNVEEIEQDEREALEDADLTDMDRLRRHLQVVHGWDGTDVRLAMEDTALRNEHLEEHQALTAGGGGEVDDHDPDWWAWRRVELAEAQDAVGDREGTLFDPDNRLADTEVQEFRTDPEED
jgi:hypothetical protein